MSAEELLACAVTYRDAPSRTEELASTFPSTEGAVRTWFEVLMHEAKLALEAPLAEPPVSKYLHPVDIETTEPGIVDCRDGEHVLRRDAATLPRAVYGASRRTARSAEEEVAHAGAPATPTPTSSVPVPDSATAREAAERELGKHLRRAERKAATLQRREERQATARESRARETPEERQQRLAVAREKREAAARRSAVEEPAAPTTTPAATRPRRPPPRVEEDDDALLTPDVSLSQVLQVRAPTRRRKGAVCYYPHPLPHHRHLLGLEACRPNEALLGALLRGEASDALEVIHGPPGTGKTRELVARVATAAGRVFLCAPTNVGAANLYARCLESELQDEAALVLSPERIPPGTAVLSDDPRRRIVCATVSARSGPRLMAQRFEHVFLDEAAQCMEAWTWTLLRRETHHLVLAGDTRQLPALVSESGNRLRHERSLMERLVDDLQYSNVTALTAQHRMAPELLAFPNAAFYGGRLSQGSHAPLAGAVEVHLLDPAEAREEAVGDSFRNAEEARRAAELAADHEGAVLITPYAAQTRQLLAQASHREVHTVDSFQGREAETVILSIVRDGSKGLGFWADARRLTVALTRARTRLIIIATGAGRWPPGPLRDLVLARSADA